MLLNVLNIQNQGRHAPFEPIQLASPFRIFADTTMNTFHATIHPNILEYYSFHWLNVPARVGVKQWCEVVERNQVICSDSTQNVHSDYAENNLCCCVAHQLPWDAFAFCNECTVHRCEGLNASFNIFSPYIDVLVTLRCRCRQSRSITQLIVFKFRRQIISSIFVVIIIQPRWTLYVIIGRGWLRYESSTWVDQHFRLLTHELSSSRWFIDRMFLLSEILVRVPRCTELLKILRIYLGARSAIKWFV